MSRKSVLHGLVNSREEEKEYTLEKIFESREINQSK